ncbi:trimeric intracellular cation channel family protein [Demetria terragena]|uniref:trimeric intracellular cation channel family protein n=1 Tax=Demetria terragena TaxID=63959 RepID=UPI000369FE76|nr:TRIC cation channel family protein [Demetria terragena]
MTGADPAVLDALRWVDLTGVLGNAILGGVIARTARLDAVGFVVLAIISGFGGGIIRDTLLQDGPPVALTDTAYIVTALIGAAIAFHVPVEGRTWNRVWPWIDALALGCWAGAGALKTLEAGLDWLPAIILGTVTAVGGGMVRDVIMRQVPSVLGKSPLYATCAAMAAGVMVIAESLGYASLGLLLATVVGASLTLLARWRNWMLPLEADWSALRRDGERRAHSVTRLRRKRKRD